MPDQQIINFESIKAELTIVINQKLTDRTILINEPVSLIDGFVFNTIQNEISNISLGGYGIPTIMLMGQSGQVYFFAVKALLPNI